MDVRFGFMEQMDLPNLWQRLRQFQVDHLLVRPLENELSVTHSYLVLLQQCTAQVSFQVDRLFSDSRTLDGCHDDLPIASSSIILKTVVVVRTIGDLGS